MANLTLTTLRTRLRGMIGNPSVTQVDDTFLTSLLNDARQEVADEFAFNQSRAIHTFSTSINIDKYTLPDGITALFRLWDETNRRWIEKRGDRWLAEQGGQQQVTGIPSWYFRLGDFIMLMPPPDGVYRLSYYAKTELPAMVNDDETSTLPAPWDRGILYLARHLYWDDLGEAQRAQYAFNKYRLWVQRKPGEIDDEARDMESGCSVPMLVRDKMGSRGANNTAVDLWAREP